MGRGLTKFVGREREIEEMKQALERAKRARGQVVAAMGEAGAGKSRLIHGFKAGLPRHCKVLEAHAVSHGKTSTWLSVIELLRVYFALAAEDNEKRRREKVEAGINSLDPALAHTLAYLLSLLGDARAGAELATMDAQVRRRRTHEVLKRLVLRDSLNQPLVVIFEDLHWIDEETQRFLETLVDGIANARVLLLVNYRPEYSHPWGNRSYYTQLRLGPLGGESAREHESRAAPAKAGQTR